MISRYQHPEIAKIWSEVSKYATWWEVEWATLYALASHGIIPMTTEEVRKIRSTVSIDSRRISEIENITKHDVMAFVVHVREQLPQFDKWIHYGLTSSDVLDTAFALHLKRSAQVVKSEALAVFDTIAACIRAHGHTLMLGRTHGMGAQPLTLEHKLSVWNIHLAESVFETLRAIAHVAVTKLSGAVGNYPILSRTIESEVAKHLGLPVVTIATQVVGRHLHAAAMNHMAIVMGVIEKIATDIRHHQRFGEMREGFAKGQTGSSAMPHKQNPIGCENLTGLSRLVRSYAQVANENIPLWMERDISHSSVERVIFPDAFHLVTFALRRLADIISHLQIDPAAIAGALADMHNTHYSQLVHARLLSHVDSSQDAYHRIQQLSFEAQEKKTDFLQLVHEAIPEMDMAGLDTTVWQNAHFRDGCEEVCRRVRNFAI